MTLQEAVTVAKNIMIAWVHLFGLATIAVLMVVAIHLLTTVD